MKKLMLAAILAVLIVPACTPEEYMHFNHLWAVEEAADTGKHVSEVAPEQWKAAVSYSNYHREIHQRQLHPFLTCTRHKESDRGAWPHTRGYGAVSPSGTYRGAYQFHQNTWNGVARRAGRPDLVGRNPAHVVWHDQDAMALHHYHEAGNRPWGGRC